MTKASANVILLAAYLDMFKTIITPYHARIQRREEAQTYPLKTQTYSFFSNTGPNPLKNNKAIKRVNSGTPAQQSAILMAFYWQADNGSLLVEFDPSLTLST